MARKQHLTGPRTLVHTPAELATGMVAYAEYIQKNPGITWGIPDIDKKVIPMRAGQITAIIARPGHGKTSLLAYLARTTAQRLQVEGRTNECVIYVSWEQIAEELEAFFQSDGEYSASDVEWGRVPLDVIRRKAVKRAELPLFVIGHSASRAGWKIPRMTMQNILKAIESMEEDFGLRPVLALFDYVQLVPIEHASDRVQQVGEAPKLIKETCMRVGIPGVLGVQARREVDGYDLKIPTMRDGQWSSAIEQDAHKLFACWRPAITEPPHSTIEIERGVEIPVTPPLFILKMWKQRGEAGQHTWLMHFEPQYLRLCEMELKYR